MEINCFDKLEKPFFHLSNNRDDFEELYGSTCNENNPKKIVIMIDGQNCNNKQKLFIEFANKMSFPDYFGYNWDAFDECLNDLEWLDGEQYVLFIRDFNLIFENDEKNLRIFLNILVSAVEEWKEGRDYGAHQTQPTPFHIVMYSDVDNIKQLQNKEGNMVINKF